MGNRGSLTSDAGDQGLRKCDGNVNGSISEGRHHLTSAYVSNVKNFDER